MYLISYDIANDKLRRKVADCLLDYGRRVQYSVFECEISNKNYKELYKKLTTLVAEQEEVSIRCYFLDKSCVERLMVIGTPVIGLLDNDNVKSYDVSGLTREEEMLFI